MTHPSYFVAKTFVGSDPTYLELLDNIVWMPRMTRNLENIESYLIMDEASIALSRKELHKSGRSYFDFIKDSGCRIITVNELIDKVAGEDSDFRRIGHESYEKLIEQIKLGRLPASLQGDFTKTLFLHGFSDQKESSVNICMDLDVMQDGSAKLPDNTSDLMGDFDVRSASALSYDQRLRELITTHRKQEESLPKEHHKYLSELSDYLKEGKSHIVFADDNLVNEAYSKNKIPRGCEMIASSEYLIAKSKKLPAKSECESFLKWLDQFKSERKSGQNFQEERKIAVDSAISHLYQNWVAANPQSIVNPSDLGIIGRYNIQKWFDENNNNQKTTIFFVKNAQSIAEISDPFDKIVESITDQIGIRDTTIKTNLRTVAEMNNQIPSASFQVREVVNILAIAGMLTMAAKYVARRLMGNGQNSHRK